MLSPVLVTVPAWIRTSPPLLDADSAGPTKKVSREKRRAAKWFLEDVDIAEEEDLPVETYVRNVGYHCSLVWFLQQWREIPCQNAGTGKVSTDCATGQICRYEEENFTRISLTKRERLMQKRLERGEFLGTGARMDHIRRLLESVRFVNSVPLFLPTWFWRALIVLLVLVGWRGGDGSD